MQGVEGGGQEAHGRSPGRQARHSTQPAAYRASGTRPLQENRLASSLAVAARTRIMPRANHAETRHAPH
ncbi:hypothetical protein HRUBRA_00534 [Pseudohaliea rubra DSM 19751]|uniref:Uncharacterized protein n=1 Tax=Pseudohaliea rubra DSM 19751 TaxID=1265313 RepID=A0A095VTR6_9GAMM|nr:hypothetical protein HRUBRA_00534 [Pseudohaliea rubra DSM 19751]